MSLSPWNYSPALREDYIGSQSFKLHTTSCSQVRWSIYTRSTAGCAACIACLWKTCNSRPRLCKLYIWFFFLKRTHRWDFKKSISIPVVPNHGVCEQEQSKFRNRQTASSSATGACATALSAAAVDLRCPWRKTDSGKGLLWYVNKLKRPDDRPQRRVLVTEVAVRKQNVTMD